MTRLHALQKTLGITLLLAFVGHGEAATTSGEAGFGLHPTLPPPEKT